MKKFIFISIVFAFAVSGAKAQQQKDQKNPDEQVIVNKKYDDQGNLIQYDSTYVHHWSVDTTFHFGFPGDSLSPRFNFPGIERFMNEFWGDSLLDNKAFPREPFSFGFRFSPFDGKNRGNNLTPFSDSLFAAPFPYQFDSLFFDFGVGPNDKFPPGIDEEFFKDFSERLNQQFYQFNEDNFGFPGFKNEEHRKEWEELIKKHQRELEELQKKWQKDDQPSKTQ
ncbi:hypothetical protein SAMN05444274_11144 [Mariniphaga anaerophila]|uniref:Uncharacterized protein n=1 Tax=Mariniphaga anaerophila TaxID=1484053 RepID=A0A1M5F7D1_9BACT|nr:hypothetical protein [Mariniphaga anaerophila]SHF87288.1 hypothetical protein SAMN05444274_11144 [Mariniphaga anaerophila]